MTMQQTIDRSVWRQASASRRQLQSKLISSLPAASKSSLPVRNGQGHWTCTPPDGQKHHMTSPTARSLCEWSQHLVAPPSSFGTFCQRCCQDPDPCHPLETQPVQANGNRIAFWLILCSGADRNALKGMSLPLMLTFMLQLIFSMPYSTRTSTILTQTCRHAFTMRQPEAIFSLLLEPCDYSNKQEVCWSM